VLPDSRIGLISDSVRLFYALAELGAQAAREAAWQMQMLEHRG
jgi:hypothetical protein